MHAYKDDYLKTLQCPTIGDYRAFYAYLNHLSEDLPLKRTLSVLYLEPVFIKYHHNIDTALESFSKHLIDEKDTDDLIFRIEHEKFVILTMGLSKSTSIAYGNRLKRSFEYAFDSNGSLKNSVRVNIGLSFSERTENLSEIIRKADKALYLSKNQSAGMLVFSEQ